MMNKLTILLVMMLAMIPAFSVPNWTILTSEGAKGDTSGNFNNYKVYFCTKADAADMFEGNDTIATITKYLTSDEATYMAGMSALAAGGTALSPYTYEDNQYSFTKYFQMALSGEYLAVLAYSDASENASKDSVRVFDAVADSMGSLTFDPAAGEGGAGNWTTVPEPTSALLGLLGFSFLSLRRKPRVCVA